MKVLLINPSYKQQIDNKYEKYYIRSGSRWPHSGVKIKGTTPHYLPFPFSLAYSASLLKKEGFEVYVIDAVAMDVSEDTLLKKIAEIKPSLIFYEIVTPTVSHDLFLAGEIKEISDSAIAVGGAHASIFAPGILSENNSIDFVLRGEYEYPLLELGRLIQNRNSGGFPGLVFRKGPEVIDGGYPLTVNTLDKLPVPLRDIFPSNDCPDPDVYWDGFCQLRPAIQMQSSRGCIYRCYFCLWNQVIYNNGKYRIFSVRRVVDEMQDLVSRYKAREIYFDDDNFMADKDRVKSICEEILIRNLKVKWSCMGDAVNVTDEVLRIMARSGCIGIKFGVESGSKKILKTIGKPIDLEKVKAMVRLCKKKRIKTHAAFMIGLAGETKEDFKQTARFAYSLDADSLQLSIATPFPGTDFYAMAKERWPLTGINYRRFDGKISGVAGLSGLNGNNDMKKIRRKFFLGWFFKKITSPAWCLSHLPIIFRTLRGLGINFLIKQLAAVAIDEHKNR